MESVDVNRSPEAKCCDRCMEKIKRNCEYLNERRTWMCPYVDCYSEGYLQAEEDLIARIENRIEVLKKINSRGNGEIISHLDAIISEIKTQINLNK